MTDTCQIALAYRGVLGRRGVRISRESYGKTWTLSLAGSVWTLADHRGENLHSFTQKNLHSKVAFPGFSRGYPDDLFLTGLGPEVYCFQPEQEVVDTLQRYVEQSEWANAPQLAKWHRAVGLGFLAFGLLSLAACLALPSWALWSEEGLRISMLAVVMPLMAGLIGGAAYFVVVGVRDLRTSTKFARMAAASARPDA